jgi:ADP-heptose:LPS heptosyltransferase
MTPSLVIYRMGSLGDTMVALPCLHRIVDAFPDHRRILLTNTAVAKAASIEAILWPGFADAVIAYPYGTRSPRALLGVAAQLRACRPDLLVYVGGGRGLRASWRDVAFFRLAGGVRRIVGAPLRADLDGNRRDPATGALEHEASRLARCLAALGPIDLVAPGAWDMRLTAAEEARAERELAPLAGAPFIVANTGGKLVVQDWGDANWTALLPRLAALRAPLVLVGGEADRARAERLIALWPHAALNTCGRLTPRESAALIGRAGIFIGHESGPMHVAAGAGIPCVAVFGPNNPPGKWFPWGRGHRVHYDAVDVRRISPDTVLASALAAWGSLADRRPPGRPQEAAVGAGASA